MDRISVFPYDDDTHHDDWFLKDLWREEDVACALIELMWEVWVYYNGNRVHKVWHSCYVWVIFFSIYHYINCKKDKFFLYNFL